MAVDIKARSRKVRAAMLTEQGSEQAGFASAILAAVSFIRRQDRIEHPEGQRDGAGRFWLDEPMHVRVRTPSRNWPWSQMHHGRTMTHCAHIHHADLDTTRAVVSLLSAATEVGEWSPSHGDARDVILKYVSALPLTRQRKQVFRVGCDVDDSVSIPVNGPAGILVDHLPRTV